MYKLRTQDPLAEADGLFCNKALLKKVRARDTREHARLPARKSKVQDLCSYIQHPITTRPCVFHITSEENEDEQAQA